MAKKIHSLVISGFALALPLISASFVTAATPLHKVRLAYSAFAYANPPFWIAHELKLFQKYGLDTELVYVSGARPIQAMLGGSIDVSQVGGAATVAAAAQGAEVAILGTIFTRLNFAVHASAQIKQVADLKGKTLATGTIGGNTYFAALLFLQKFGWVANKDVQLFASGCSPEVLQALVQGRYPAGVLTPPTTHLATRMGFREIFDLASLDFKFPPSRWSPRANISMPIRKLFSACCALPSKRFISIARAPSRPCR